MNLNSPFSVSSQLALAHLRVAACHHTDRQRKQPLCISRARSLEVSCGDKTRDRGRDSNYDFDRRALVSIILSVQTYTFSMQRARHTWVQLGEIVTFLVDPRKTVNGDSPDAAAGAPRHYHSFSTSGNRDTRNKEKAQSVPGNNGPGRSGDNSGRGDDTPSSASGDDPGPQFACHFYKKNPTQYGMCLRYNLTTVSRVQQHLKRCHKRLLQCPTCRCTFGENQRNFDEHLRARSCQSRLLPLMPERALSEETWRSITARRRTPHQSARDRWYVIWTIIFPEEPLPHSPYYTVNETTQQLVALNNHFIENGYGQSLVNDIMQLLPPELQVIGYNLIRHLLRAAAEHAEGRRNNQHLLLSPTVPAHSQAPMPDGGQFQPHPGSPLQPYVGITGPSTATTDLGAVERISLNTLGQLVEHDFSWTQSEFHNYFPGFYDSNPWPSFSEEEQ